MARRSIVDQVVGNVKTEASKRPIPIDPSIAEDLLAWYRTTQYSRPDDYVFATDAPRAGKKRGKQPVWLSKIMQYYIQPAAKRVGITKRIGWHTFRLFRIAHFENCLGAGCCGMWDKSGY